MSSERNLRGDRVLITGGAGTIGSHIVDQLVDAGARARSSCSTTSSAAAARTSPGRWPTATVEIVEGDIRDRDARARADARHRRRLPPGGDPHHPVRGGAAAGARGPRRRHLQRPRGRRAGGRAQARRRLVGLGLRPGRGVPHHASDHHPYANDTLYGAAKVFNEGLLRSFHAMYGPRLRRAALLQRLRPADGRPRPLHRGARPLDGAHRGRRAAADLRRRPADDGLRLHRRHRPRQHPGRRLRRSPTRSSTSPAASRRACSSSPRRCCR